MVWMSHNREASKVTVNSSYFHPAHQHYTDEVHKAETVPSVAKPAPSKKTIFQANFCETVGQSSNVSESPSFRVSKEKTKQRVIQGLLVNWPL
jgi:hypothetical protein